jgi:hypothetical protein
MGGGAMRTTIWAKAAAGANVNASNNASAIFFK